MNLNFGGYFLDIICVLFKLRNSGAGLLGSIKSFCHFVSITQLDILDVNENFLLSINHLAQVIDLGLYILCLRSRLLKSLDYLGQGYFRHEIVYERDSETASVNVELGTICGQFNAAIRLALTEDISVITWYELLETKLAHQRELFNLFHFEAIELWILLLFLHCIVFFFLTIDRCKGRLHSYLVRDG